MRVTIGLYTQFSRTRTRPATNWGRVSLDITHMQLVGDEDFHPEDLYGIPNGMLHNRTVSRVTNTPQSAGFQRQGSPGSEANLTNDLDKLHDQSLEDLTHISDSMIATQKLPSPSQPDRPAKKMRLSGSWALRMEERIRVQAPVPRVAVGAHVVHCQCWFLGDEGEMVQCSFCDTYQHLRCYGYLPQECPKTHACYRCLFQGHDDQRLSELQDLALTRRCLWILYGHDVPRSHAELARRLGKSCWSHMEVTRY